VWPKVIWFPAAWMPLVVDALSWFTFDPQMFLLNENLWGK